eukprot:759854-Hanusia_phi.AAC.2
MPRILLWKWRVVPSSRKACSTSMVEPSAARDRRFYHDGDLLLLKVSASTLKGEELIANLKQQIELMQTLRHPKSDIARKQEQLKKEEELLQAEVELAKQRAQQRQVKPPPKKPAEQPKPRRYEAAPAGTDGMTLRWTIRWMKDNNYPKDQIEQKEKELEDLYKKR